MCHILLKRLICNYDHHFYRKNAITVLFFQNLHIIRQSSLNEKLIALAKHAVETHVQMKIHSMLKRRLHFRLQCLGRATVTKVVPTKWASARERVYVCMNKAFPFRSSICITCFTTASLHFMCTMNAYRESISSHHATNDYKFCLS